ncbi:MAG: hypothetical protein O7G85_16525 [Planctomycetota bacterium]|nr:hypothetical protein [Planctomycetota bacterium]
MAKSADIFQDDASTVTAETAVDDLETDPHAYMVSWWELVFGSCALILWFSLFAGGILINIGSSRTALTSSETFWQGVSHLPLILSCWTVTNVGVLAVLAAILGAVGRRTRFTSNNTISRFSNSPLLKSRAAIIFYASAVIRGFGVYSLLLGGLLILATATLVAPSQEEYLRLALTISIISFYAGYNPEVFASLLKRAEGFFRKE